MRDTPDCDAPDGDKSHLPNVRFGSTTEVSRSHGNVCFRGQSGSRFRAAKGLLVAKRRHWQPVGQGVQVQGKRHQGFFIPRRSSRMSLGSHSRRTPRPSLNVIAHSRLFSFSPRSGCNDRRRVAEDTFITALKSDASTPGSRYFLLTPGNTLAKAVLKMDFFFSFRIQI